MHNQRRVINARDLLGQSRVPLPNSSSGDAVANGRSSPTGITDVSSRGFVRNNNNTHTRRLQRRREASSSAAHDNNGHYVVPRLTYETLMHRRTSTIEMLNGLYGDRNDEVPLPGEQQEQVHRRRRPYVYHGGGFRSDYQLGNTLRHPSHLIIEPSYKRFLSSIQALNKHEFAFIKRSNGSYSYAILANRSMEPIKGECLTFVMNESGSTKTVRKCDWGERIRLIAADEYPQEEQDKQEKKNMEKFLQCFDSKQRTHSLPQEITNHQPQKALSDSAARRQSEGGCNNAPPIAISFAQMSLREEEEEEDNPLDISSVSSASEYARYYGKYFS